MTVNQINDSLIAAMETLASKLDKDVTNTMTIECTITATVDAEEGEYTVEYLGNKFTAKAIDRSIHYSKKDNVFVIVPNGDFSGTKMIIGYPTNRASKSASIEKEVVTGRDILFFPKTEIDLCSYIPEEKEITFTSDFYKETFPKYQEDGYKKFRLSYKLKVDGPMENQTINNSYGVRLTIPIIDAGGNPDEIVTILGMQGDKGTSTLIGDPYNLPVWVKQNVDITIPAGAQIQPEGIQAAAFVYGFNTNLEQNTKYEEYNKEYNRLYQQYTDKYNNYNSISASYCSILDEKAMSYNMFYDTALMIAEQYENKDINEDTYELAISSLLDDYLKMANSQKEEIEFLFANYSIFNQFFNPVMNSLREYQEVLRDNLRSFRYGLVEYQDLLKSLTTAKESYDVIYRKSQEDIMDFVFEEYQKDLKSIKPQLLANPNIQDSVLDIHIKQIELHAVKQFTSTALDGYNLFINTTDGRYLKSGIIDSTTAKAEFRNNGISILLQTLPIYWFVQDPSIRETDAEGNLMNGYSSLGGDGWRLIKSGSSELDINIKDIVDKRLYKCMILYDSQTINSMFYIDNLGPQTISISSAGGTDKIVRDVGVAELTCNISGDGYSYLWGAYSKDGVLLDTFSSGKTVTVHSSKLDDTTQFQCVAYLNNTAAAWAFYTVSLVEDLGYHVEIENGGVAIKYDAYGHSPKSPEYSGGEKYALQPLTYTIYRADGIKFNASEYSQVTATWRVPTTETCMLDFKIPRDAEYEKEIDPDTGKEVPKVIREIIQDEDGNDEEIRTYYEFSYKGLDEVVRYGFAQHKEEDSDGKSITVYDIYDAKRRNNTVYLTIKFGDITLYDNSKFRISKEGTKETRYATKEVITGIKYTPKKTKISIPSAVVGGLPTEIEVVTDIQISPITETITVIDN